MQGDRALDIYKKKEVSRVVPMNCMHSSFRVNVP